MSYEPSEFRDNCGECQWIFDFFAHGFDYLNGRFMPSPDESLGGKWSSAQDEINRQNIVSDIAKSDGAIPDSLRRYLDVPGGDAEMQSPDFYIRLFAVLSAVDQAAADLNYLHAHTRIRGKGWMRVTEHFERHGKQLQQKVLGYVVFKPRYFQRAPYLKWADAAVKHREWTPIPHRGEYLDSYFENLLRVHAAGDCSLEFRILNPTQDFHEPTWPVLRLGIVPLVQELKVRPFDAQLLPGPLILKKETSASPPSFSVQIDGVPSDACRDLCKRAEAGLVYLAQRGCQVIIFPELVMPDPVLKHVKGVLARLAAEDRDRPCLTLAGTFTRLLTAHHPTKPFNVAVLLNDRGEELWRQRKAQPYDMHRHEQQRFGLDSLLGCDPCRENIAFMPRSILSIDSRASGMRIMVLICEDLTRAPGTKAVRDLQPTLILTPVMAGPLEAGGGFAESIDQLVREKDGIFVVANSAGLARAAWKGSGDPPLGLLGLPLLNVAQNYRPFETITKTEIAPGSADLEVLFYQFPK